MSSGHHSFSLMRYVSPQYWPTWAGLAILRLIVLLPYKPAIMIGRFLGGLIYRLPTSFKRIARVNLSICFPEYEPTVRERILRQYFDSIGIGLIEIGLCWWGLDKLVKRTEVIGLENIKQVTNAGQGAILLTAHFTTLEVGGSTINSVLPVAVMYREQNNLLFNEIMNQTRSDNAIRMIHRNDIKSLVKLLRNKGTVWYAPDQNYGGNQFVFADFFGIQAATSTATARIASITNAQVLPFYQVRLPDYKGYKVYIDKPLDNFPTGDQVKDTETINKAIEERIRLIPEQYLWSHRRFKKRPEGEESFY